MKGKLLLFVVLALSLVMVSCDRFEKPTQGMAVDFFNSFSVTADSTTINNTSSFMSYFHTDYLQDGKTKQDVEHLLSAIFDEYSPCTINVELINNHTAYELINNEVDVEWYLIVKNNDSEVVDSLYFEDKLIYDENSYSLYGNQKLQDINEAVSSFFTTFSATANTTSGDNIDQFMNFFHADYLQDGKTKEDIQAIINSAFLVNEPRFISVDFVSNTELSVVWNLIISTTDDALVESMEFNDKLIKVNEEYYLYGNQVEPVNEEKLMPFAEIMTATWCGTCPQVEAAMHEYHESNPNNFFYLEFHTQDAIAGEHEFFDNFYALTSAPGTVIQGKDIFSGDASETYPSLLDSYKNMDAQLKLSNLLQSTSAENYQAQVDIENLTSAEFDTTNLKLRWAFYEDVSATNNYIGVPCRHVVLTEGFYDISSSDIDNTFNISIDYPREIPEDMGIVFWLQTASDAYDENSFVHGWIKHDLGSK